MALWHFVPVALAVVVVIALNLFVWAGNDTDARDLPIPEEAIYVAIAFGVWLGLLIFGLAFVVIAQILLGESFSEPNWGAVLFSGFVGTVVAVLVGAATIWYAPLLVWPICEVVGVMVAYYLAERFLARRDMRTAA